MSEEDQPSQEYVRYLYMLRCNDNSIYTGITDDPAKRIQEHNDAKRLGAYTASRLPVEFALVLETEQTAYKIECFIKGKKSSPGEYPWSHKKKWRFIYHWRRDDKMELDDEMEEWLIGTRNVTDSYEPIRTL